MPRARRTPERQLIDVVALVRRTGLNPAVPLVAASPPDGAEIAPLRARIAAIRGLLADNLLLATRQEMVFLLCYDIAHDRVRRNVARYIQRKGMYRVQRSVFVGTMSRETAEKIHQTLGRIQAAYNNHDSILLLPLGPEALRSVHVIGAELDVDLLLGNRSMLFF